MRDSLIQEIQEHYQNNPDSVPNFTIPNNDDISNQEHTMNDQNELMNNDEMENMTYDIHSGKRHVKGKMLLELEESESDDNSTSELSSTENSTGNSTGKPHYETDLI